MTIKFQCSCGQKLKASNERAGTAFTCPQCGGGSTVPCEHPQTKLTAEVEVRNQSPPAVVDPQDIKGYGKTIWGMTEADVLKAESPRVQRLEKPGAFDDGSLASLGITLVEIAGGKYEASFVFEETFCRLTKVILTSCEKKDSVANDHRFASIEKLLTEKYGVPTYTTNGKRSSPVSDKSVVSWKLKRTMIELSHSHIYQICSWLNIIYSPVESAHLKSSDL